MLILDEGLILRKISLVNADEVVVIFFKELGKISCKAKGIKHIKSRKAGNIDLLNYAKISLAKSKTLDIITEIKVINYFENVKEDPSKFFSIYYISEVINKVIYDGEIAPKLFNLIIKALHILDSKQVYIKDIISYLNVHLIDHLGVFPDLDHCFVCKSKFDQNDSVTMFHNDLAHHDCMGHGQVIPTDYLKILKFYYRNSLEELVKLKVDSNLRNNVFLLTTGMLEFSIDTELKSKIYIK